MKKASLLGTVVVAVAVATVVPGAAVASTAATVATPGTTSSVAPGPGVLIKTAAHCSSGDISAGGVKVTGPDNGIDIMETEPSTNGTSAATGGATDPTYWLGYGGTGGNGTGTYTVQPFGVCFTNATITHTQVVVSSTSGPTTAGGMTSTTAICPAGTRLLGGGARSTLASNRSVKVIGSYPSSSTGAAAADASTNPTSWTAVALNGGMSGTGNTTSAFAICSGNGIDVNGITVTVRHTNVAGPTSANSQATATTSACGVAGNLVSGGASISGSDPTTGSFTVPGSQGDHLDGDYPSGATGAPTGNTSATTNWTAIGHSGGMSSPSTDTDVWGLCMS